MRARRARRKRTLIGALLVALALVAVALSMAGQTPHRPTERRIDAQVTALLAGIPQRGTVLGDPHAPVTVTYYGDLECPTCAEFTLDGGFPQLVAGDVRRGAVRVDYRSLCTATCAGPGQDVFDLQQAAAYAAGAQKRFWYFAELAYHEQGPEDSGYVTGSYLDRVASQIPGLAIGRWRAERQDPALAAQLRADAATAARLGISGTPTLIVSGPNGRESLPEAIPSYAELERAIQKVG